MLITFLSRLLWLLVLIALQMLVFNHIHLLGYATALPYVYLLMLMPKDTPRWQLLLWGFAGGLAADVVSLTPGVGAGAMTVTAMAQPSLLRLFEPKDAPADLEPSLADMGVAPYMRYAAAMVLLFCTAYFALLAFSFFHLRDLALSLVSTFALTLAVCLSLEALRKQPQQHGRL